MMLTFRRFSVFALAFSCIISQAQQRPPLAEAPTQRTKGLIEPPEVMHWCSQHCSVWVLDKGEPFEKPHYGSQKKGSIVIVEKFSYEEVIMQRTDYGAIPGKATLRGKLSATGDSIVESTIEWTWHPCCGTGTAKYLAAWGAAINTVPASDQERANLGRDATTAMPASNAQRNVVLAPRAATAQANGNQTRGASLNAHLAGTWQSQLANGNLDRLRFRVRETKGLITLTIFGTGTEIDGITIYEGRMSTVGVVEGRSLDAQAPPQRPHWTAEKIFIDDANHIHFELSGEKAVRTTAQSDHVECTSEISRHTAPSLGFERGRNAIFNEDDFSQAACWFRGSSVQNDPRSQGLLAFLLYAGKGVSADYTQAIQWATKSAGQKDPFGEMLLSAMYKEGKGTAVDAEKSAYWSKQAGNRNPEDIWGMLRDPKFWNTKTPSGLTFSDIREGLKEMEEAGNRGRLKSLEEDCRADHRSRACYEAGELRSRMPHEQ